MPALSYIEMLIPTLTVPTDKLILSLNPFYLFDVTKPSVFIIKVILLCRSFKDKIR